MLQPITTDTSDFEALRKAGQTYVDKTAYFHRLVTDVNRKFFFLARPRRFGKSLAVTTQKSIFLGHREFFRGLAIDRTDYDWKPHAVIHFNWGTVDPSSVENFDAPYRGKGLPVYLVGLGFDSKTRHLADAAAKVLD